MGIRQIMGIRAQQEAAEDGAAAAAGGGEGAEGAQTPEGGGEGAPSTGGMMRSHSQGGQGGGEGEGEGDGEDPFKASANDDGRPTIKDDQGNEIPLPDQFWDAENQTVKADSLFKSFRDTKSAYDKTLTEKKTLEQKLESGEQTGQVPEKPEGYTFEKPEEFSRELSDDDQMLQGFKQIAHKHGIPQDKFQGIAADYLKMAEEQLGPPLDPNEERKKLGPNADTILQANAQFFDQMVDSGTLSREEHDEIMAIGETAAGVKALNKIREKMGEQPIPMEGATASELPSKDEWYRQMNTAMEKGDHDEIKRLEKQGAQIFGTGPAGSSEAGLGVPG